jgi:hypothetical protein
MGKTKLIITIEVEETLDETGELFNTIVNGGKIRIKNVFDPESELIVTEMSDMHAVNPEHPFFNDREVPEAKPTFIECIMTN